VVRKIEVRSSKKIDEVVYRAVVRESETGKLFAFLILKAELSIDSAKLRDLHRLRLRHAVGHKKHLSRNDQTVRARARRNSVAEVAGESSAIYETTGEDLPASYRTRAGRRIGICAIGILSRIRRICERRDEACELGHLVIGKSSRAAEQRHKRSIEI